jgi:hypothetical protein
LAITFFAVVGMFGKTTITRTLAAQEPMVNLDAAAITQRIGSISHPAPAQRIPESQTVQESPLYRAMPSLAQPTEAKWRRALRPRPGS